ncbi:MAG: TIGR00730 family Rossman fold protein [Acidobacteria bacterium]|nr:MAG: TIGR00730 family Rossman fold protein [Acidobacteriota bacterium]
MENRKACVYCGSSRQCDSTYLKAAERLGRVLARNNFTVVYGGGAAGSMKSLADGVVAEGGRLVGVIPEFMVELEWMDPQLPETIVVNDMHERKKQMIDGVDAVIALPGGCGTLEELMEAITWKRLGLYLGAIVILNTQSFYQPLIRLLDQCIGERFMDTRHARMWSVVGEPEEVPQAISAATPWSADCRSFAALR